MLNKWILPKRSLPFLLQMLACTVCLRRRLLLGLLAYLLILYLLKLDKLLITVLLDSDLAGDSREVLTKRLFLRHLLLFLFVVGGFLGHVLGDFGFGSVFDAVEALYVVFSHRASRLLFVDEADHGAVALGVELVVVVDLYIRDASGATLARLRLHVLLQRVPPVREEPLPVFQLDLDGLIIEAEPIAGQSLPIAAILGLAELRTGRQIFVQLYFPNRVILEAEFVVLGQDLHLVGQLVGAHLFLLK